MHYRSNNSNLHSEVTLNLKFVYSRSSCGYIHASMSKNGVSCNVSSAFAPYFRRPATANITSTECNSSNIAYIAALLQKNYIRCGHI